MLINTADLIQVSHDEIYEHISELYSIRQPENKSKGLGYLSRTDVLNLELEDGSNLSIQQSISSFNDSKTTKTGTTGFMTWSVSPLFVNWFLGTRGNGKLIDEELLHNLQILELGSGVSGILASTIGVKSKRFIATDQSNLLRLLKINIEQNTTDIFTSSSLTSQIDSISTRSKSKSKKNISKSSHTSVPVIEVVEYDWELSDPLYLLSNYFPNQDNKTGNSYPDLIIACDTVYNEYLIRHFLSTLKDLSNPNGSTNILIALQLRDFEIMEKFLELTIEEFGFSCFSIPDEMLSNELKHGYAIYYLIRSVD